MGLRPIYTDQINDNCSCLEFFSYLYTMIIICLLILGYILQFMACFKRDRGFAINCNNNIVESNGDVREANLYDTICNGSTIFSYIIPNALHLIAYFYAVLVFRTSDDDQLTSLMERVIIKEIINNYKHCWGGNAIIAHISFLFFSGLLIYVEFKRWYDNTEEIS